MRGTVSFLAKGRKRSGRAKPNLPHNKPNPGFALPGFGERTGDLGMGKILGALPQTPLGIISPDPKKRCAGSAF
ncbi:hypothetical protein LJC20_01135 [Eubacteriales bacterium OttesenSCG-928-M02]|nr:hypothetical protein [Eubacteriales bacterium OttesenSCG-928-M02]